MFAASVQQYVPKSPSSSMMERFKTGYRCRTLHIPFSGDFEISPKMLVKSCLLFETGDVHV